ncbi:type IV toxin-antitoxin system AbiEi family antitoxin domain-containing protein [Chryseobacterium sp. TY4]|uniref:type IV toxin-antitoxin system AbiEi family antitoxin domain-containing protein n=1 Tax=Chryseobacterium echinoideorum TaxID=1549648 RepID=UPI001184F4C1|nr:hypothetical protein [Chryseobacterium echinoideorum]
MNFEREISAFQSQPIPHSVMLSLLNDYKRPNDKIHEMIQKRELLSLKKGLYILNSELLPEPFAVANAIYGPSYISAESALSYREIIPEKVFSIVSMTMKPSKNFKNQLGNFEFKKVPTPYYAFGIEQVELRESQFALLATAEKAILDKVVTTRGMIFRSVESAKTFMLENMRMDESQLKELNTAEMQSWIPGVPKEDSLKFLIKAIEKL